MASSFQTIKPVFWKDLKNTFSKSRKKTREQKIVDALRTHNVKQYVFDIDNLPFGWRHIVKCIEGGFCLFDTEEGYKDFQILYTRRKNLLLLYKGENFLILVNKEEIVLV